MWDNKHMHTKAMRLVLKSFWNPGSTPERHTLKPNSHQTIFPTDFQRHPKIKKSVVVGRFFFKKSVGVTWKSVGQTPTIFIFKSRTIFSPISPPILTQTIIKHVW